MFYTPLNHIFVFVLSILSQIRVRSFDFHNQTPVHSKSCQHLEKNLFFFLVLGYNIKGVYNFFVVFFIFFCNGVESLSHDCNVRSFMVMGIRGW